MGNTNLTQRYYKGKTSRTEGIDSTGWWFTGGTSFMSNGYVIYKNGLDGYPPNPTALAQGTTYDYRMFDQRSLNPRSSYAQFITYLSKIADQAAANEEAYLTQKVEQLKKNNIDVAWIDQIVTAIKSKEYSAAYTLLMRREKDLEKFRKEISSNRNKSLQKTNEFFNSQFYKFIQNKFEQQLENQSGFERYVSLDADFEAIVDEFLKTTFNISIDENQSLQFIRQQFINGLEKVAKENGGKIYYSAFLQGAGNKATIEQKGSKTYDKNKILTKKGKYRSYRVLAKTLADDLASGIGRGLSTEVYTIAAQQGIGGRAFSTGNVQKVITNSFTGENYTVSQKADVITYDCYSAEFSLDDIIGRIYERGYNEQNKEFYDEVERQLIEAAKNAPTSEFFQLVTNVKGYRSKYDLQIEGEGSFSSRMSTLSKINLGGNMTDKLIFMLNNTTQGCIAEGRESELADYLAAVCVAWMWDNSDELFDLDSNVPSNYHKIYLFNSGGAYFTASQIIQQTIETLVNYGEDTNRFVKVSITPPAPYGDYTNLMATYPVNGIKNKDEWDKMLQQRWEAVKQEAMQKGTLAIHFQQEELDELLSSLRAILKEQ